MSTPLREAADAHAETRPVAEQALAALETERKLLEKLGESMPAGAF